MNFLNIFHCKQKLKIRNPGHHYVGQDKAGFVKITNFYDSLVLSFLTLNTQSTIVRSRASSSFCHSSLNLFSIVQLCNVLSIVDVDMGGGEHIILLWGTVTVRGSAMPTSTPNKNFWMKP